METSPLIWISNKVRGLRHERVNQVFCLVVPPKQYIMYQLWKYSLLIQFGPPLKKCLFPKTSKIKGKEFSRVELQIFFSWYCPCFLFQEELRSNSNSVEPNTNAYNFVSSRYLVHQNHRRRCTGCCIQSTKAYLLYLDEIWQRRTYSLVFGARNFT